MSKQEFLAELFKGLSGLPQDDIEERLIFYSEMIDDRMEEGISEEEAVREIGSIDEIVSQIVSDIPLTRLVKSKITPKKKLKAWEIALLVIGSPMWLSILIAAYAAVLSVYISLWAVIVSMWAAFVAFAAWGLGGTVAGVVTCVIKEGGMLTGIAWIGTGIASAGLAVFMFYACRAATKGIFVLSKRLIIRLKSCFIRKEEA